MRYFDHDPEFEVSNATFEQIHKRSLDVAHFNTTAARDNECEAAFKRSELIPLPTQDQLEAQDDLEIAKFLHGNESATIVLVFVDPPGGWKYISLVKI